MAEGILFFCLVEEEKCVEEREGEKGVGLSGGSLTRWGMGAVDYLTITNTFFLSHPVATTEVSLPFQSS